MSAAPKGKGLAPTWRLALSIALMAVLVLAAPSPPVAYAATINVTTTNDELNNDGDCSLREAIEAANTNAAVDACTAGSVGMDTINLPAGTYTLSIAGAGEDANQTGDLDILEDLTIVGAGASSTVIDADGIDRVLHVVPADPMLSIVYLDISGVTITGGELTADAACVEYIMTIEGGGGICAGGFATVLTIADSVITGNRVTAATTMSGGGGILAAGYVSLDNCTISYNAVAGETYGMGGGLFAFLTMDVVGSTFNGNQAPLGGGIAPVSMAETGASTVVNSTLSGNSAMMGGGLATYMGSYADVTLTNSTVTRNAAFMGGAGLYNGGGTVQLKNTIVADQLVGNDCYGTMTSLQYNIDSDNTCNLVLLGDQPSTDPLLGSLQDHGGPTWTHELLAGSPAIDAVADGYCTVSTDQRGVSRPFDGDGDTFALCDSGSFEAGAPLQIVELTIEKSGHPNPVYVGEELVYNISVTNNGTATADPVVVMDTLPAEVEYQSDTGGCTVYDAGPPEVLECDLGALGPSETFVFEITVLVRPDAEPGIIVNSATVNDEATDTTRTLVRAPIVDLVIDKTDSPDPVMAGQELFYQLSVTNVGQATATSVTVTDTLPAQVQYIDNTDGCIGPDPSNTLICSLGDLAGGASRSFEIKTRVRADAVVTEPDATLVITNTAQVGSEELEYNPADNSVTQSTFVEELADLTVLKWSKPDEVVQAGEVFTYTIFVENLGPSFARNISIRDETLSSGSFQVVGVILDPNRSDGGPYYEYPPQGGVTMEFDLNEALEPKGIENEGRWVIQIVLQADETQDVNNLVQVFTHDGGTPDPDLSNNQDEDSISVADLADLSLSKSTLTPPFPPFYAGNDIRFQLQVTNNGPSAAENVVLEDMLPEGVAVFSISPGPWSCTTGTPGSEPLRCNLGTLDVDASATVIVSLHIDPDYLGALENDAVVSSDIYDPDNSNNRDYVIVNVSTSSDVFLKKGCGWDFNVLAGDPIQYDILVRNDGPSTVHNFELWDLLPNNVTYLSYEMLPSGGGECFYTPQLPPMHGGPGQGLHCYLGDISPDDTRIIYVRARVHPDAPEGYLTNWVSDYDADSNFYLDYSSGDYCNNYVINEADLSVSKTANPWKVFAGEQVMYDVSVTNYGPGNAYEVLVTDTLPSGVGFELSTDPECLPADGDVVCEWDMLGVGQTRIFQIFGRVDPSAEPGTVSNRVWVDSLTAYDPVEYNDYASAPILIQGRADLKVQKFGKPEGEVRAGDELTYTVIVDNLGTGYAHSVTLDDVLESDGSFDLLEVTSNRDALCDPVSGTFENDMFLSCALSDTLEVKTSTSGSGRWMLTVVVLANEPQDINNVAYVAGSDFDPDLSNNEAMAEHEITAVADLELTKEAWGQMLVGCEGETELWLNEVAAGGMVTYTLTVSNTGPSTAENVVVLDEPLPLPDLLEIDVQSITPSQGNCQTGHIVDQGRLSCNLGTILPGESASVTFVAHVPSWVQDYTVLVNDAQAYSDMFDNNNGNDIISNQTIVSRVADLEIVKTQDPEIALPGWDITYSITVANLGLSDAEGVFISDTIPMQVLNPTWTCCASDGQCDIPCEPPTCPVEPCPWPDIGLFAQADIPAGEWVIYTVEGTLDWWPCGPFTNTVEIFPPQSLLHPDLSIDPCDENNVSETVNDPFCHYDPLVLKEYPEPDSPP
jgi:uncharacterized repeat protein (TIGR01451 family)/CSLREA domain-containing protein